MVSKNNRCKTTLPFFYQNAVIHKVKCRQMYFTTNLEYKLNSRKKSDQNLRKKTPYVYFDKNAGFLASDCHSV